MDYTKVVTTNACLVKSEAIDICRFSSRPRLQLV